MTPVPSITIVLNTLTNTEKGTNIYNSIGACYDQCQNDNFGWAIVQYQGCWCSNEKPTSDLQSISACDQDCPGYPDEQCGAKGRGLFGYVAIQGSGPISGGMNSTMAASSMSSMAPAATSMSNTTVTGTMTAGAGSSTSSGSPAAYTGAASKKFTAAGTGVFGFLLSCLFV